MLILIRKKNKNQISLKEHYNRRNKVLIKRRTGGYGDILMSRMMFEDFSKTFPEIEFYFSCPKPYMNFAEDHPYVKTKDINSIEEKDYGIIYDITTACRVQEMKLMDKNKEHRSDIWAKFCGMEIKNHNPHFKCDKNLTKICKEYFEKINPTKKPIVLFTPLSSSQDIGIPKSLTEKQIFEVVEELKSKGYFVFSIHNEKIDIFEKMGVYQFVEIKTNLWAALVNYSDYVISIDTATFHLAGCLKKPLVGIFSFTDGKIYGKYYNFKLIQKHKDNGNWSCGPCYYFINCPKSKEIQKPCLTELKGEDIIKGFFEVVNEKNN
jgi:ADP-heptose:LPS heptosyltransferase